MAGSCDLVADFESAKSKVDMYLDTMRAISSRGVKLGGIIDTEDGSYSNSVSQLLDNLNMLVQPRAFCCGGWVQLSKTDAEARLKMTEDTTNQSGWPINEIPVDSLLEFCTPAQYGDLKLQQTVYNPKVRMASECEASKFQFIEKPRELKPGDKRKIAPSFYDYRPVFLDAIRKTISTTLANSDNVTLACYKLNVYGEGGFFNAHVDTPVDPSGMIGTVVVCLPSKHMGGVLTVKHQGFQEEFAFADLSGDRGKIQWAAFYSDCIHEILPVQDGNRITITYNIIRRNTAYAGYEYRISKTGSFSSSPLVAVDNKATLDNIISDVLQIGADEQLEKFGIFLQHKYTMSALAAGNLKGCDQVLYDGLTSGGLTCHPLTVLVHEHDKKPDEDGNPCDDEEVQEVYAFSQEDMAYVNKQGPKPQHASWKEMQFIKDWSKEQILIEVTETEAENYGNWTEPGEIDRLYLQSAVVMDIPKRTDQNREKTKAAVPGNLQ